MRFFNRQSFRRRRTSELFQPLESRVLLSAAYAVTDLGTLAGYTASTAQGVNASGEVVGSVQDANGDQQAFLWTPGVGIKGLGFVNGASDSMASAINNSGEVTGTATSAAGNFEAFTYTAGGGLSALGTLAGGSNSTADAINDSGQVAGSSDDSSGNTQAAVWSNTDGVQGLGYLPGAVPSAASGINNNGEVVGSASNSSGSTEAFLWTAGTGITAIGFPPGSTYSAAAAINSSAHVAVTSFSSDGSTEASYLWSSSGGFQSIGALGGAAQTIAAGLNDAGQVVGESQDASGNRTAFVWSSSGGTQNLNNLLAPGSGWTLLSATGINANGQIVGQGINPQGAYDAFLLSPPGLQPAGLLSAAISAPPIAANSASPEAVTVVYTDTASAINANTIAGSNLTATGPGGAALAVSLASVSGSGQSVTATYNVAPPGGSWTLADNGAYSLSIAGGTVTDAGGVGVGSATGSFSVSIAPAATGPFTASISEANITSATAAPEAITVNYTDTQGTIITSGIAAAGNLTVTGPDGAPLAVTESAISGTGGAITVIYNVAAPDGSWSSVDNGTYAVSVGANSLTDSTGAGVSAATSSFSVSIPASQQPPPALVDNSVLQTQLSGKLPTVPLVAGGKIVPIHQTVRVTNSGSTKMTGVVTVDLLLSADSTGASNGTSAQTVRKKIALKTGASASIPVVLRSLPAGLTGSIFLIPEVIDSTGNTSFIASVKPITILAPFVDLTGRFVHVPSTVKGGKKGAIVLDVQNQGNVATAGLLAVDLQRSDSSTSPATVVDLGTLSHHISIKAHGQMRIQFIIPFPLTGGPFTLTAILNSNNAISENNTANNTFSSTLVALR